MELHLEASGGRTSKLVSICSRWLLLPRSLTHNAREYALIDPPADVSCPSRTRSNASAACTLKRDSELAST
jgi:hypothetical protein